MANGMGSLYIGSSGLRTSQNALNTTANNLANVDRRTAITIHLIKMQQSVISSLDLV